MFLTASRKVPVDLIKNRRLSALKKKLLSKLTTVLLTAACLQLSVQSFGQTVTFSQKNVSLEKVFAEIKKQTGFEFLYSTRLLQAKKNIDVSLNKASLEAALTRCMEGTGLAYTLVDKTIVIKQETQPAKFAVPVANITVSGKITDNEGTPLGGATVKVKGTNKIVITDNEGGFILTGEENAVLEISYVGYTSQAITVNSRKFIAVALKRSDSPLDQIQIIAYGTNNKRFSVGSVATLTAADIEKQPVSNVLLALQGQVSGLFIAPTSGAPGAAVKVQIRGQNSLKSDLLASAKPFDQPLFIVDGLPMASQNANANVFAALGASGVDGFVAAGGLSPFNSINPADIESISFLKDADATSIYGTQGANGVILITTKKGKPGKTTLNMSVNTGVNLTSRPVQMLNTQQYLELRREAFKNDGFTSTFQGVNSSAAGYAPDLTIFDQNKSTDWYNNLFGKSSTTTNAYASLSGGSNTTNFIVSAGFTHTGYTFPGGYADNRITLHTGFQHSALGNRLTISFNSDLGYDRNNSSSVPSLTRNILTPPNFPDLLDNDGNLLWRYQGYDLTRYQTEGSLKKTSSLQAYNTNNAFLIAYKILPGLKISTNLGYSRFYTVEKQANPLSSQAPQSPQSTANFGNNTFQTINIEPQVDYKCAIGKGDLSILAGSSYRKSLSNSANLQGVGYPNDALLGSISGATTKFASEVANTYKYVAVFGRIGYIYDQKYIISLNGRRDGSSNFGPGNRFGNFGSVGLGWIVSEENFFKSAVPLISFSKLSANYGTSGSDAIAPYMYQTFWRPASGVLPFQGFIPITAVNHTNPDYSWSKKRSLNIAFDLGLWKDKLLINATWYQNSSGNQLVNYRLPVQTGFTSVLQNLDATVQNTGWEFTLTSSNFSKKGFSWKTSFNISANRNKLKAFDGLQTSSYASLYTLGKSVNVINVVQYKGVDPATGLFEFYDKTGTLKNNASATSVALGGDALPLVDNTPKYFGGLTNNLTYKNFNLSFNFQFSKQTAVNYLGTIYRQQPNPGGLINEPAAIINRWRAPGDISEVQIVSAGTGTAFSRASLFTLSTGVYSDASYIRLKNVALSYTLPAPALKKLGIKNCSFFVNAQNLLTITSYKVGDPEIGGGLFAFPLQRTIVSGLSFNF